MAALNQFGVYLPDELARDVRQDVEAGRYVVKEVLRAALEQAHENLGFIRPPKTPVDPEPGPAEPETRPEDFGFIKVSAETVREVFAPDSSELQAASAALQAQLVDPSFFAPAVGEPVPQRTKWFASKDDLDQWLTAASDRGERIESISYDATGGSILALITNVVAVSP